MKPSNQCFCCNAKSDATHTGGPRRDAFAKIRKALRGAYGEVQDLVQSIPVEQREAPPQPHMNNAKRYYYDLTDRDTDLEIRKIVEKWFETGVESPPPRWFMSAELLSGFGRGVETSKRRLSWLANISGMSTDDLGFADVRAILQTRPFKSRIDRVYRRAFEEMKSFTGDLSTDLARTLADGAARGVGPRKVSRMIQKRFKAKKSDAERVARTEIGHAYRDARLEMAEDARDRLEIETMMQWVSALAPTTRRTHAQRHLNYYTIEQVREFYTRDANEINCLCRQQEVMFMDGKPLGQQQMTDRDREMLKELT